MTISAHKATRHHPKNKRRQIRPSEKKLIKIATGRAPIEPGKTCMVFRRVWCKHPAVRWPRGGPDWTQRALLWGRTPSPDGATSHRVLAAEFADADADAVRACVAWARAGYLFPRVVPASRRGRVRVVIASQGTWQWADEWLERLMGREGGAA